MYQMGKRQSLLAAGKFGYANKKEWNAQESPSLISHTQVNLKWIKDLYIKPENVKLLSENKGKKKNQLLNNIFVYDNKITSNNDYIKLADYVQQKKRSTWKATWGMRENIFKLYIW